MIRTTREEIDAMRKRGFDRETIRQAEDILSRTIEADRLCERVRQAFADVKLGDGIGLFEAQALDDYESDELRALKREKDEKEHWERIEARHLNACSSSLFFFDPPGMRFHLPAFLVAELRGEFDMGVEFALVHLNDQTRLMFGLLDSRQRQVVREFLVLLRQDPDSEYFFVDIDRELDGFWRE